MLFVYRFGLIWAVAALALVGLIAVTLIVPLVLRGVRPLAREAARLDPQELSRRLPEGAVPQELLPIVRAFNAALDRLSEAFERRRRFIADVAHELRTPLAVLNMHVEALAPGGSKPDLQRGVYRLGQMVGQMLDAERLTLAARQREPVDLVELVRESVADVAPLAVASGYEIAVATEADALVVEADRHALARAIGNLLGNAIAHGGNAGLIEARIARSGFIEVADEGPGVPPEARERIFEPFGRERWDRDGCGLGLHLVREIMAAHGGRVELARSRGGATFRLVFQVGAA
jgi:signal transduction histidine kinase